MKFCDRLAQQRNVTVVLHSGYEEVIQLPISLVMYALNLSGHKKEVEYSADDLFIATVAQVSSLKPSPYPAQNIT